LFVHEGTASRAGLALNRRFNVARRQLPRLLISSRVSSHSGAFRRLARALLSFLEPSYCLAVLALDGSSPARPESGIVSPANRVCRRMP